MDDKTRIEFKGQVDQKGHFIYGRLTQYNLKSGLEELALEGSFENGRLNGKIRYYIYISTIVLHIPNSIHIFECKNWTHIFEKEQTYFHSARIFWLCLDT